MNVEEEFAYCLVFKKYLKEMGRNNSFSEEEDIYEINNDIIPHGFETGFSFENKIRILAEGIEKKIPLDQTNTYNENIEGVRKK